MKENPNAGIGCCLLPFGVVFGMFTAGFVASFLSFLPEFLLALVILAIWGFAVWLICFWLPKNIEL